MPIEVKISTKVTETENQIARMMIDAIKDMLNDVLLKSAMSIQRRVRDLFIDQITNSDTWESLKSGKLRAEFGMPQYDVEARLKEILDIWVKTIIVDYKPIYTSGTNFKGGITLSLLETDWQDVISSQAGNIALANYNLPWMEWLLTYGDKIIIRDFVVKQVLNPRSRSGMAIMVESKSGRWRVPPEFSGTTNNNFVTRILDNINDKMCKIIEDEIVSRI